MAYIEALTALADPTRREIFDRLRSGPRSVGELASSLPVSQPAVSQHLRRLREAGLVAERRVGTRHYFHATPEGLAELRGYLEDLWSDVLAAYAASAPRPPRQRKERS